MDCHAAATQPVNTTFDLTVERGHTADMRARRLAAVLDLPTNVGNEQCPRRSRSEGTESRVGST